MFNNFLKIINVLVFRGFGSGASIFFAVLVARHLNSDDAALIYLLTNIVIVLAVCVRWGMDEVIIRRVAVAAGSEARRVVCGDMLRLGHGRVVRNCLWLFAGVPFFFCVDRYFAVYNLRPEHWLFILVTSFTLALVACYGRVFQGLGKINLAMLLLNILVPGVACIWILGSIVILDEVSVLSIMLEYLLSAVILYVCLLIWTKKKLVGGISSLDSLRTKSGRNDLRAANRLGTVIFAQQSLLWGSSLLVPALFDSGIYTVFVISQKLSMVISFVMLAVNFTFSSRMALLFDRKDYVNLSRLVIAAGSFVGVFAVLVAVSVLFFRAEIIDYTNMAYANAGMLLSILVVSQVFNAMSALFSVILSMVHQEKYLMRAQLIGNVLGFALFSMLALRYNITIASCAFVATYLALAIGLLYRIIRILTAHKNELPIV